MAAPDDPLQNTRPRSCFAVVLHKLTRPAVIAPLFLLAGMLLGYIIASRVPEQPGAVPANPLTEYADAVRAAAVKRPEYRHKLLTIDPASAAVQVVTFHDNRALPTKDRAFDVWVSSPDELRAACQGSVDPVRTLQEVLGLPLREAKDNLITTIEVSPQGLFRPCLSRSEISDSECALVMPAAIKAGDSEELRKLESALDDAHTTAGSPFKVKEALDDLKTLRAEYDRLYFLTKQMWTSYQQAADSNGYPFTGMGWTYDWGRRSPEHVGVSEFVIRRDAQIKIVSDASPADFCKPATSPGGPTPPQPR